MTRLMHERLVQIAEEDLSDCPLAQYMERLGMHPEASRSVKLSLLVPANASTRKEAEVMLNDMTSCLAELSAFYPEHAEKLLRSKELLDNSIAVYSEFNTKPFNAEEFINEFINSHA